MPRAAARSLRPNLTSNGILIKGSPDQIADAKSALKVMGQGGMNFGTGNTRTINLDSGSAAVMAQALSRMIEQTRGIKPTVIIPNLVPPRKEPEPDEPTPDKDSRLPAPRGANPEPSKLMFASTQVEPKKADPVAPKVQRQAGQHPGIR